MVHSFSSSTAPLHRLCNPYVVTDGAPRSLRGCRTRLTLGVLPQEERAARRSSRGQFGSPRCQLELIQPGRASEPAGAQVHPSVARLCRVLGVTRSGRAGGPPAPPPAPRCSGSSRSTTTTSAGIPQSATSPHTRPNCAIVSSPSRHNHPVSAKPGRLQPDVEDPVEDGASTPARSASTWAPASPSTTLMARP